MPAGIPVRSSLRGLLPLVLAAFAPFAPLPGAEPPVVARWSEGLDTPVRSGLPDDPAALLRLDDEMRSYFAARVGRPPSVDVAIRRIAEAILEPDGLAFRYDDVGLHAAGEAFRRRAGNCLTFTILFVAVAREFRIPAAFNEVPTRPHWSRSGGIVLEAHHVNARVDAGGFTYQVDIAYSSDLRPSWGAALAIDDRRAFAMVYNDDGVRLLAAGDREAAIARMRKAVAVDPEYPAGWVNLGSALAIAERWREARDAYEHALRIEPECLGATGGLARVLRVLGESERARVLAARAQRYRERNPYYLLHLAQQSLDRGELDRARRLLDRAYRIKKDEPDIVALQIALAERRGREREVGRWRRRLAALQEGEASAGPIR